MRITAIGLGVCLAAGAWGQCEDQWVGLSGGVDNGVYALTPLPNGDVVAGGGFVRAGGVRLNQVGVWGPGGWHPTP